MKIKEMIKNEVDDLDHNSLLSLYEYISTIKKTVGRSDKSHEKPISIKTVQELLSNSTRDWAQDLITEREDRL